MPIARAAAKPAAVAPKAAPAKPAPATVKANNIAVTGKLPEQTTATGEQRLVVSKTLLENGIIKGVPVEAEEIEVRLFATNPATVTFGQKFKKNVGNYESVEVYVAMTMPCYAEDVDSAQQQVISKVQDVFNDTFADLDIEAFRGEVVGAADFAGGEEGAVEGDAGAEGAAEDGGELTEEWIDAATREELDAFLVDNPVEGLDPADYADDDDLKSVVKGAFFPGEEGEAAADEAAGYTQEELEAATMDDLKGLYAEWQIGAFPAFTTKNQAVVKKNAIAKILAKQAEASAAA